jgi:hypothetical protein
MAAQVKIANVPTIIGDSMAGQVKIASASANPKTIASASASANPKMFGDSMFGPYNQAVPLIIASVAVGTSIVNRTPVKLVGHLVGALIVGLIAAVWANRFVAAFLGYTIGYVYTCFKNGIPDTFTITGITMGFAVLLGINVTTTTLGSIYFFTMLASVLAGFGGVYATQALFGSRGVYDFKGCSCADCATTNQCPNKNAQGGNSAKILARRIS